MGYTNMVSGIVLFAIVVATQPARGATASVIERIYIHGNARTRDKTIRREIGIAEGRPLATTDLETARRRLEALGVFTKVEVSMRPGSSRGLVTLHIDVAERPGTSGFSSLESFIAVCAISQTSAPPAITTRSRR